MVTFQAGIKKAKKSKESRKLKKRLNHNLS